jgi:hypothetical protein
VGLSGYLGGEPSALTCSAVPGDGGILLAVTVSALGAQGPRGEVTERGESMLHELRIYETVPGRMPALHQRFREITSKFFEKHGIRIVAYWEALIGTSNQLYYLVEWESLAERERKWGAFGADPDWAAARSKTEESGPIVARVTNMILRPTDYSPLK